MKNWTDRMVVLSMAFFIALSAGCGGKKEKEAPAAAAGNAQTEGAKDEGAKDEGAKDEGAQAGGSVETGKKENPITANKTGIFELEGEITNINTVSNTFILRTPEGDVDIYVRAMSRMLINGERQSLSGIKSGSYAKGTFKKWDGKDTVAEIVITAGK